MYSIMGLTAGQRSRKDTLGIYLVHLFESCHIFLRFGTYWYIPGISFSSLVMTRIWKGYDKTTKDMKKVFLWQAYDKLMTKKGDLWTGSGFHNFPDASSSHCFGQEERQVMNWTLRSGCWRPGTGGYGRLLPRTLWVRHASGSVPGTPGSGWRHARDHSGHCLGGPASASGPCSLTRTRRSSPPPPGWKGPGLDHHHDSDARTVTVIMAPGRST